MTGIIKRFTDPEAEKTLVSAFSQEREMVKQDSAKMGKRHLPALNGDSMASYFENHHLNYQSLLDGVNKLFQMETTVNEGVQSKNAASKKILALQSEISEAEQKLIMIEEELKKRPEPTSPNKHKWVTAAIILLTLGDGLFSVPVFEAFGYSKVESWLLGLLLAFVLAGYAHFFPMIVKMGKTKLQRILITLGLSGLAIGLFTYLSISRVKYLEAFALSNGVQVSYSPIPFILTSVILLGVAVFMSYFYMPSKQELQAIKEYKQLQDEKKRLQEEIEAKTAEIEGIQKEHDDFINDKGSVVVYARQLENMIINEAMSSFVLYKKNNLMCRGDGKPDCYHELYPFEFRTHFNQPKLISNEEQ